METQIVAPPRTNRSVPVLHVNEIVPARDLPTIIGRALQENARDSIVAIGIGRGGEKAHVIIAPASAKDEQVTFRPDLFRYVAEMAPFGEFVAGKHIAGVRALRVAGFPTVSVLEALRPMLETHGPALLAATRGYLSAPVEDLRWVFGSQNMEIHVQGTSNSFSREPRRTFGAVDGRFAVTTMHGQLVLVSSSKRADPDPEYPERPDPRLTPVCMNSGGTVVTHDVVHISAPLWPDKTRGSVRPSRWYHLVQGAGKTTLVSVGSDNPGRCATFRSEGHVEHPRFARIVFLDVLGGNACLTRDAVTGLIRPMGLAEVPFLPKEVNQLVRSF